MTGIVLQIMDDYLKQQCSVAVFKSTMLESKSKSLECTHMVNSNVEFLAAISFMIDVKAYTFYIHTKVHSDNNFSSFTLQSYNPIFSLKS